VDATTPRLIATRHCSRRILLLVAVLVAACARPLPTPELSTRPARLAVITWNMHAGAGNLPRLVEDLVSGRLVGSPPRDYVLLLQEAVQGGAHDPASLARERHLSLYYIVVRRTRTRVSGNAILSTLPLTNTREIALPRARQMRSAAEATINIDGANLFVVDAHLENRISILRGALFSDTARGRQADALLEAIPPSGHGVAGGDFNTWLGPNEPAWKKFLARFHDTPEGRSEPTFRDRLVLDHLFFDVPDGWRVIRRVVHERYDSDHNPVIGLIETP
jgi:endonuclease/exonuclease/phosphatase family metal-dependent hydrolase